tara:strand:- start:1135 stop:1359 length:225 start_codon:yes stop_codon:yes gene_type:complete
MTRSSFLSLFKHHTNVLVLAIEDKLDLEYDHPELFKKLYNYYKEGNTYFYNDRNRDYNILIEELEIDLLKSGVI